MPPSGYLWSSMVPPLPKLITGEENTSCVICEGCRSDSTNFTVTFFCCYSCLLLCWIVPFLHGGNACGYNLTSLQIQNMPPINFLQGSYPRIFSDWFNVLLLWISNAFVASAVSTMHKTKCRWISLWCVTNTNVKRKTHVRKYTDTYLYGTRQHILFIIAT